jgi:hypothetical protein
MLLNKQESPPAIFLNASDSEDAIVDEVASVGFCLFFVALGVWPTGSHVFYVLSTCTRRQPHVPHGLDLQRE